MNLVDTRTVKNLELRAPAASEHDASFLRTCMDTGKIFAQVLDPILRKAIMNNICAVERLIPSLWTFLEDVKRLEPCARAVRMLLELQDKSTIYKALRVLFAGCNRKQQRLIRQDGENHFVQIDEGDKDQFEFSYRQLWIYAMRHFPDLVSANVEGEATKDSSCVKMPISIFWYRFARLALRLGFRSRKMELMGSTSALDEVITDCISWVAGASKDGASPHHQAAEVRKRLQVETDTPPETAPSLVTDDSDLDIQYRYRRPFEGSRRKVELGLFIRWLYDTSEPRGRYITQSFVQRAIFQAFFGRDMRRGDEGVIELQQVDDPSSKYGVIEAENETASQGNLSAGFGRHVHKEASELVDHGGIEHHQSSYQESGIPISAAPADIKPSPDISDILSPRDEEAGSQQSLAEIIMKLQEPTGFGACRSQRCSDVPTSHSSPTRNQAVDESMIESSRTSPVASIKSSLPMLSEVSEPARRLRRTVHPDLPISPRTPSEQSDQGMSMLEDCSDYASGLNGKKELLLPALEIAPDTETITSTNLSSSETLIALNSPSGDVSVSKRGFIFSEYLSRLPESTSYSRLEQDMVSATTRKSPDGNAITESLSKLSSPSDIRDPKVPKEQFRQSETILGAVAKAPTKRICEIVAESQSCIQDYVSHFLDQAERKNPKRSFREYSTGLEGTDTLISPDGRGNCTVKRHRFSTNFIGD